MKFDLIQEIYEDSSYENDYAYMKDWDSAIVGYSCWGGDFHVVYDEELIINAIMEQNDLTAEEAMDMYSHDTSFFNYSSDVAVPIIINRI